MKSQKPFIGLILSSLLFLSACAEDNSGKPLIDTGKNESKAQNTYSLADLGKSTNPTLEVTPVPDPRTFLAENANKPGVTVLPSGLQYKILKEGTGPKPVLTDTVTTHYHGTLIDGTVFDSSVQRGQPISFPVNGVIKGWQEALQLMPVGSKWQLVIPSSLAYGERGSGSVIGPNEPLVFEVELLSIG